MGTPGLGHKSYIQIGKESTYGTQVASTKKLEVISMDAGPDIGTIEDPSLYAQASRRALYQGGLKYSGRFVFRCNYEGLGRILEMAFGQNLVTGPAETASYTQTCKSQLTLPSYSIQMIEGDITTTLCQTLLGAKCKSLTVRGKAGQGNDGMVTVELEVLAKDKTIGDTPTGALSFANVWPVLFHKATTVTEGSGDSAANVRVREFEVVMTNNLTEDRFYLGNVNIDEPLRSDFLEVNWRFVQEFQTMALFTKAKAFTAAPLKLIFQDPTIITGATTLKREFELRSNQANLVDYQNPVQGFGVVLATSRWRAFYDVTDTSSLLARVQNSESAI